MTNSWVRTALHPQGRQSAWVRTVTWHLGLTPLTPRTYLLPTEVRTQTERGARPELTHSLCGRNDLSGQLSVRHAFNMTRGRTAYRSLTDKDGDRSSPKTSLPCCFTIAFQPGLHSLLSHGYFHDSKYSQPRSDIHLSLAGDRKSPGFYRAKHG